MEGHEMIDRDRRLAEMMGLKWCEHEYGESQLTPWEYCNICGRRSDKDHNPDFSLPGWRARLMDFCVEQEWWDEFCESVEGRFHYNHSTIGSATYAYLWRNLPDLVYQYDKEKGR